MFQVITGGSGSGKSEYAESCILNLQGEHRIYVATMFPFDEESHARVRRHQNMRKEKQFTTEECYINIHKLQVAEDTDILLECMSNLVANEMYMEQGAGENTVAAVLEGIRHLKKQARNLIVVTNEVFSDGIFYDVETQKYLQYLGEINCGMAQMADKVTEVVYGIPVKIK